MDKSKERELQKKKWKVLFPLFYKNPKSKLYLTVVDPEDGILLSFPHLPGEDILLLEGKRYIGDPDDNDEEE